MAEPEPSTVAVVGLGKLGLAICERLVACGFAVTGTDLLADARAGAVAVGAASVDCAANAVTQAAFVVSCLPGDAEVGAIVDVLPAAMAPGAVWLEMSTVSPLLARSRDDAAAANGVTSIDAPVGGNPDLARRGALLCFAGGPRAALDAARPVLSALADRIVHVGGSGAGYLAKLLANASWFAQAVVMAETLTLASSAGLDPETVRAAIAQSAAGGRVLADDAPAFLRGETLASFSLARCADQLATVVRLGERHGVEHGVLSAVAEVHRSALAAYGDVDGELLGARWVADSAGLELG